MKLHHGQLGRTVRHDVTSCGQTLAAKTTGDLNAVDCEDCLWTLLAISMRDSNMIAMRLKTVQSLTEVKR